MLTPLIVAAFVAHQPTAPHHTPDPWTDRFEWSDEGPAAREHASVLLDSSANRVIVYAGSGYDPQMRPLADAWAISLDSGEWARLEVRGDPPSPGGSKRVAQAPGQSTAYIFGGYDASFSCNNDLHRVEIAGDALVFTAMDQTNPPPGRALHAIGFDPIGGALVTALGVRADAFFDDLWVGRLDGDSVNWTRIETPSAPDARFGFAYGFDADTGELVVVSGQLSPTPESPMRMSDELWTVNVRDESPEWTRHTITDPPPGRRNPCFAYDDSLDRLVVWCGTADARTNLPGLITFERGADGSWAAHRHADEGDTRPPRRSSGAGIPDPRDSTVWFGLGNSAEGAFRDLCRVRLPD